MSSHWRGVRSYLGRDSSPWRPRMQCCLVICGASLHSVSQCLLSLTLLLTVADVTLPQRGSGALVQRGGVRWVCIGWSEAVGLRERRITLEHTFPSEDYQCRGVKGFFFHKAQGDRTVNETKVKSQNAIRLPALLIWQRQTETRHIQVRVCVCIKKSRIR